MLKLVKRFLADERGLETVEYAVMTALIVTAIVLAITTLGGAVKTRMESTTNVITGIV